MRLLCLWMTLAATLTAADSPLIGTWKHQRDSGGWRVLAGGQALLRLDKGGHANLTATAPNQSPMIVDGTWSEVAGRVTINIPGQFEIKNGPYQMNGDTVVFPSELSTDNPGSSTWVRVVAQGTDLIFAAFNRAVEEGKSGQKAADEAAKEAQKQKGVEKAVVTNGGEGIEITDSGPVIDGRKPRTQLFFATRYAPRTKPVQRKLKPSLLASQPNTHINAANPPGDPDAPQSRTALLVSPYFSRPHFAFRPEVWKQGDTGPRALSSVGQTTTMKELGDDPPANAATLEKAGYHTTLLLDEKATPGAIYHALAQRPGVVYISTHGGAMADTAAIGVGPLLGIRGEAREMVHRRLHDLLVAEGVPGRAAAAVTVACIEDVGRTSFCFPLLWPGFFKAAVGSNGLPESFVYIDACHSAQNTALAQAFKPKAYLGFEPSVAGWASARFARFIFSNMARNGHSVREAWDRMNDVCENPNLTWPEDEIISPPTNPTDTDLKTEAHGMVAMGINQQKYDRINTETMWLMYQARRSYRDINGGANALERCWDLYWKDGKRTPIADQFCNDGISVSMPIEEEVYNARHLVSGNPKQPIGRFVLR